METQSTGKIVISRPTQFKDLFGKYKIYINDTYRGGIFAHGILELEVAAGDVKIQGRIDWCRSQPINVQVKPGETVRIEIFNNASFLSKPPLWWVTYGRGSYLKLKSIS